jgi:hypothetical protein
MNNFDGFNSMPKGTTHMGIVSTNNGFISTPLMNVGGKFLHYNNSGDFGFWFRDTDFKGLSEYERVVKNPHYSVPMNPIPEEGVVDRYYYSLQSGFFTEAFLKASGKYKFEGEWKEHDDLSPLIKGLNFSHGEDPIKLCDEIMNESQSTFNEVSEPVDWDGFWPPKPNSVVEVKLFGLHKKQIALVKKYDEEFGVIIVDFGYYNDLNLNVGTIRAFDKTSLEYTTFSVVDRERIMHDKVLNIIAEYNNGSDESYIELLAKFGITKQQIIDTLGKTE